MLGLSENEISDHRGVRWSEADLVEIALPRLKILYSVFCILYSVFSQQPPSVAVKNGGAIRDAHFDGRQNKLLAAAFDFQWPLHSRIGNHPDQLPLLRLCRHETARKYQIDPLIRMHHARLKFNARARTAGFERPVHDGLDTAVRVQMKRRRQCFELALVPFLEHSFPGARVADHAREALRDNRPERSVDDNVTPAASLCAGLSPWSGSSLSRRLA